MIDGTTDNPLMELAQAQLEPTDYYGWAKLAVIPNCSHLDRGRIRCRPKLPLP